MSFTEAIRAVFSKYAVFEGRASRSEFWNFVLFNFIVSFVLGFLGQFSDAFTVAASLWSVIVFLPNLGLGFRRLHDIGKSGWHTLIVFIPLAGIIIWIVWMAREGDFGENEYGPEPEA